MYSTNCRIPNGTYGGARGRQLVTASYSIYRKPLHNYICGFLLEITAKKQYDKNMKKKKRLCDIESAIYMIIAKLMENCNADMII